MRLQPGRGSRFLPWLAVVLSGLLLASGRALAQETPSTFLVRAGTVHPVSSDALSPGEVLVREGKLAAVGSDLEVPEGVPVLDFPEAQLIPGLIDAHSHLGNRVDWDEVVEAWTPQIRGSDAFDPTHPDIQGFLREGIVAIAFAPGEGNVLGGQLALIELGVPGGASPEMIKGILRENCAIKFSFTAQARHKDRRPTSLEGEMIFLREKFESLRERFGWPVSSDVPPPPPPWDEGFEALRPLLDGRARAVCACRESYEILAALRFLREEKLSGVLLDAREGLRVSAELRRASVPAIVGPFTLSSDPEWLELPALLAEEGIPFAFCTNAPAAASGSLRFSAALAIQEGLEASKALRALTLTPAELYGVSDQLGSLETGKHATFVLLDGPPLSPASRIKAVFINGKQF